LNACGESGGGGGGTQKKARRKEDVEKELTMERQDIITF